MVKLVVDEPETPALRAYVDGQPTELISSAVAIVEVSRAVELANPSAQMRERCSRLLDACVFIAAGDVLLRAAARLASRELRTLDAIHLASAELAAPHEVIVYDRRLKQAAEERGFAVASPGA